MLEEEEEEEEEAAEEGACDGNTALAVVYSASRAFSRLTTRVMYWAMRWTPHFPPDPLPTTTDDAGSWLWRRSWAKKTCTTRFGVLHDKADDKLDWPARLVVPAVPACSAAAAAAGKATEVFVAAASAAASPPDAIALSTEPVVTRSLRAMLSHTASSLQSAAHTPRTASNS